MKKKLISGIVVVMLVILNLFLFNLGKFNKNWHEKENAILLNFDFEEAFPQEKTGDVVAGQIAPSFSYDQAVETFKTAFGDDYQEGLVDDDPRWRPVFSQGELDILQEIYE